MTKTFHFAELDSQTKNYLLNARDKEGRGLPGLYFAQSNWLPVIGMILGVGMIIGILWFTLPPYGDPLKTAMWQMAFLLPGVWMFLAALRVWIASGGESRPGHFIFVDPAFLYQCRGYKVAVTRLEKLKSVDAQDNFNEGNYTGTVCTLNFPGVKEKVTINNGQHAVQFLRYVDTILALRETAPEPPSVAVQGMIARRAALDQAQTDDAYQGMDEDELPPEPPTPRAAGWAPSGILAIVVILAAAVGGVFLLKMLNTGWRDNALFQIVQTAPMQERPLAARAYLLDPRNTRHRDKVEEQLRSYYAGPIAAIEANATDPDLKKGMVALMTAISKAKQPLISARVKEEKTPGLEGPGFSADQIAQRETDIAKRLATTVTRVVGPTLVEVVEVTAAEIPVMIQINYKFLPSPGKADLYRVHWTVSIRERPDAEPLTKTIAGMNDLLRNFLPDFQRQEEGHLMRALTGQEFPADGMAPGFIP